MAVTPEPLPDSSDTGESVWLDQRLEPRSPLSEDIECDVAVVGGGIVGVTVAHRLARAGVSTVLLEARTCAGGVTGHSTAKLSALQGLAYSTIAEKAGRETAEAYAELNLAGLALVEETARQLEIDCDFARRPAVTYAESEQGVRDLAREMGAAREVGLDVSDTEPIDLPFDVAGSLTLADQAHFNPASWVRGVVSGIEDAGGRVFERSRVKSVDGVGRRNLKLENGRTVNADRVVLATHVPILDRGLFFARVSPMASFAVTGTLDALAPTGLYLSVDDPTRSITPLPGNDRGILVGGEGHRPGTKSSANSVARLREFLRSRFDAQAIDHQWGAHDLMSFDRAPLIGQLLPFDKRVLTATGLSKWGLAAGAAASRILTDHILGNDTEQMRLFNPNRFKVRAMPGFVKHNLDSGVSLVADRLKHRPPRRDLAPGEGLVVGSGVSQKAISRDREGVFREVSARCTHMGCIVAWNQTEQSWDCPCHGSRFAPDGSVVEGPAVSPLERTPVDAQD